MFLTNEDLIHLPGAGTEENPHRLENASILAAPPCLIIRGITVHLLVKNCIFIANSIDSATVLVENSQNIRISEVEVIHGHSGLVLSGSNSCIIEYCNITDAIEGISSSASSNNMLQNNRVFRNTMGIMLYSTNDTTIESNSIFGNSQWGIQVDSFSQDNEVYYNKFGWNANWRSASLERHAADHGIDNRWDDGVDRGNNYTGFDGETPHAISGVADSVDRYPSYLVDAVTPVIDEPEELSIPEGGSDNYLTWTASDEFPANYRVWRNDMLHSTGPWHSNITVNLDDLSVGSYNMTIEVADYENNVAYSHAMVYVSFSFLTGEGAGIVVAASFLSVMIVIVLIGFFKKLR
jgi:parallel beta-helix repeat protein